MQVLCTKTGLDTYGTRIKAEAAASEHPDKHGNTPRVYRRKHCLFFHLDLPKEPK